MSMSNSPVKLVSPSESLHRRPEAEVAPAVLEEIIDVSLAFNKFEGPTKWRYLERQQADFVEAVSGTDGYMAAFGTGHPYYATEGGTVYSIDELESFTEGFRPSIRAEKGNKYGAWPCAACVEVNDLPDLKAACKPCDEVTLKPRDVFKFLPDLDYWVVVDETVVTPEEAAADITERVEGAKFYNSDGGISLVLDTAKVALEGIVNGNLPDERLPVDLHIVTAQELVAAIMRVPESLTGGPAAISPLSWHRKWERSEEYDFLKDFVFSFTMLDNTSAGLDGVIRMVRQYMQKQVEDPVELISRIAPKEARQLMTPNIARLLRKRVNSWQR